MADETLRFADRRLDDPELRRHSMRLVLKESPLFSRRPAVDLTSAASSRWIPGQSSRGVRSWRQLPGAGQKARAKKQQTTSAVLGPARVAATGLKDLCQQQAAPAKRQRKRKAPTQRAQPPGSPEAGHDSDVQCLDDSDSEPEIQGAVSDSKEDDCEMLTPPPKKDGASPEVKAMVASVIPLLGPQGQKKLTSLFAGKQPNPAELLKALSALVASHTASRRSAKAARMGPSVVLLEDDEIMTLDASPSTFSAVPEALATSPGKLAAGDSAEGETQSTASGATASASGEVAAACSKSEIVGPSVTVAQAGDPLAAGSTDVKSEMAGPSVVLAAAEGDQEATEDERKSSMVAEALARVKAEVLKQSIITATSDSVPASGGDPAAAPKREEQAPSLLMADGLQQEEDGTSTRRSAGASTKAEEVGPGVVSHAGDADETKQSLERQVEAQTSEEKADKKEASAPHWTKAESLDPMRLWWQPGEDEATSGANGSSTGRSDGSSWLPKPMQAASAPAEQGLRDGFQTPPGARGFGAVSPASVEKSAAVFGASGVLRDDVLSDLGRKPV